MELPQPPQEEDLRNIIEKLAVFVARNGVEFESMTKQKQRDNPRFGFLFGGEFYNYYMYRVTTEQAILKHKAMREQQQQQQQQNQMQSAQNPNMAQQNFQHFGGGGPPRIPNPFEMPQQQQQNFDGPQNFRGPGTGKGPQMFENRNFNNDRGGFQRQQQQPGMGNFDQQQRMPGPPGNFDQQRMTPPGNFDQRIPGNFDQRMAGPGNFEQQRMSTPGKFDQRMPSHGNFDQRHGGGGGPRMQGGLGNFDQRIPVGGGGGQGPTNFNDQRKHGQSRFDQPPPGISNFDPNKRQGFNMLQQQQQQLQQQQQQQKPPIQLQQQQPFQSDSSMDVKFDPRIQQNQGPNPQFRQIQSSSGGGSSTSSNILNSPAAAAAAVINTSVVTGAPGIVGMVTVQNSGPGPSGGPPAVDIEALTIQKKAMEEQIRQSEQNLAAQHQVLLTQQQSQIDEAIRQIQDAEIMQLSSDLNVDLGEFDRVLEPIIQSCTKDAISSGKAWIFTHTSTQRHYHLVTSFLLRKTIDPNASFNQRLHIIYLVNDVLHHCMRKGADDLQKALEDMVIPMFCYSKVAEAGSEENVAKLDKLFTLWETKSNYVSQNAVERLRNVNQTLVDFKNEIMARHAVVVAQVANNIEQTYQGYQNQHQLFCQHVAAGVKALDQQIQQAIIQKQIQLQQQQQQQQNQMLNAMQMGRGPGGLVPPGLPIPGVITPVGSQPPPGGPSITGYPGQSTSTPQSGVVVPPPYIPPADMIPDLKDPGFQDFLIMKGFPTPPPEKDLIPALPYYELPAGLMVPLVKLEDDSYKPIDPKAIRLPPPCPPSDRLLQAVEAFYAQPSHERPRVNEGWERLGLYEYFKAKNLARKQKEDEIKEGKREKSRSPTPIRRDSSPNSGGRSPPRRRYQSKSPTSQRNRRRSRSRSPSSGSSRRKKSRRSRSRSRSPPRRSPTPPSFSGAGLGMDKKLDESNKGHQLLKKMGWGGMGLGANEQGIEAPISGGEIRDKKDQYRGVGISANDPFESYRKSKGQAFVERMRSRQTSTLGDS